MCNWMHRWYRPGGEWTPDTVAEDFIQILEAGYLTPRTDNAHAPEVHELQALRREVAELKSMVETLVRTEHSGPAVPSHRHSRRASVAN
jgi:hypothetical protein